MVSRSRSDPNPDPGIDWAAAAGLYTAIVASGVVSVLVIATDGTADTGLALVSSAVTGGLLCGVVAARAMPELAIRLGGWRWRMVGLCVPAFVLAGGFAALSVAGILPSSWTVVLVGLSFLVVGVPARLLALVTHDAYVGREIEREHDSRSAWTWYQSGTNGSMLTYGVAALSVALVLVLLEAPGRSDRLGGRLLLLGVGFVVIGWAPTVSIPTGASSRLTLFSVPSLDYVRGQFRAYDAALVYEPKLLPTYRRAIPWDQCTGVRVSEDELVLERRYRFDIRCHRDEIDDLEDVLAGLESAASVVGDGEWLSGERREPPPSP